jgi:WD40 repeat protein
VVSGSGFDSAGKQNNLLQFWNARPLAPAGPPIAGPSESNVYATGFDNNGSIVAAGSTDGTARIWDVARRTEDGDPLVGDQNPIFSVAFAHENMWIAAGGAGGTVRLWDRVHQPPEGIPLDGHRNWVHSVAFSPDDRLILSGSADGNLRLWPAPQDVGTYICSKLTTNMNDAQWDEWISTKIPRTDLCDGLPEAPQ